MSVEYAAGPVALGDLGRTHLIGIGGAGMSVVATLLAERGATVQGSDARGGKTVEALRNAGIQVWVGHSAENVRGADSVVVSSAVRSDNPELVAARAAGAVVLHRSQALAALMTGLRSVAVAGAHGKTTTSAMVAVTLGCAGRDPSYAIGGSVRTVDRVLPGGHSGRGAELVAEADESDGSFLNYRPSIAVVTNVEPDHLDHYGSREAFDAAFVEFAERIVPGGWLVACADDPGAAHLAAEYEGSGGNVLTYGGGVGADLRLVEFSPSGSGSSVVVGLSQRLGAAAGGQIADSTDFELSVPGRFNALNALAALAVSLLVGVPLGDATAGLGTFLGTGRRFEELGSVAGVRVVDDYAHHPTEVRALLTAARQVVGSGRVVVLFQPHLFSRTRIFAREFAQALSLADVVVVTDVFAAREDPVAGVDGATITGLMPGESVEHVADLRQGAHRVASLARPGDLILTVGAGDVTEMGRVIMDSLSGRR